MKKHSAAQNGIDDFWYSQTRIFELKVLKSAALRTQVLRTHFVSRFPCHSRSDIGIFYLLVLSKTEYFHNCINKSCWKRWKSTYNQYLSKQLQGKGIYRDLILVQTPKLCIPSTINIWKRCSPKTFGQTKMGCFWQISLYINLTSSSKTEILNKIGI